jgi:hypothetical protein
MADAAKVKLKDIYPVPEKIKKMAYISGRKAYDELWKKSVDKPEEFWGEIAGQQVDGSKNGIKLWITTLTLRKVPFL